MRLSRHQLNELYLAHGMPRAGYEHLERYQKRTITSLIGRGLMAFDDDDMLMRTAKGNAERERRLRRIEPIAIFVDWKTSGEMGWPSEVFTLLFKRWDVDRAKRILKENPRESQWVHVSSIERNLARSMPSGKNRWSMSIGVHVDWNAAKERVANGHNINLHVPLIAVVDDGDGVIIDGHHRAAVAVLSNVELLPVAVLEQDEAKRVRC